MAKGGSVVDLGKQLIYTGLVTSNPGVGGFWASGLANFDDHFFEGWSVYVSKKADRSAAAPFREQQVVATYVSAGATPGAFTLVLPFTATLAVGDEVYVIHPDLAAALGAIIPTLAAILAQGALIKAETDLIPADVAAILAQGALIKASTDKLAGAAPAAAAVVANWQAAETNLVLLGANDTRNKLHLVVVGIQNLVGTVTIRMYMQVNGVERRFYEQNFTVALDGPALPVVNGTMGIHEVVRVTVQSNNAADNGASVDYDAMLEAQ